MQVKIFSSSAEFREWLKRNHDRVPELWLGFYNKRANMKSITYREALDEALCFGWIDGVRKSINKTTYKQRFTPRKPKSYWSAVNIRKVEELTARGLMTPAGLAAFARRTEARSGVYSYENRHLASLDSEREAKFRANSGAWKFFAGQPPSYRQTSIYRVMNAKRDETRSRRLEQLIDASAHGRRL